MKFILNDIVTEKEIYDLYKSVGWSAYTDHINQLISGINSSLYLETIRIDGELIGLLRAVGDGHTILYIQDIIIAPKHQRQGLGKKLLENVLSFYKDVRQKILLTDNERKTKEFYTSVGGKDIQTLPLSLFLF